jgi:hypothetical protein
VDYAVIRKNSVVDNIGPSNQMKVAGVQVQNNSTRETFNNFSVGSLAWT